MSAAEDRRRTLLAMVVEQGYCTTTELARVLAVSEMTVRRDVARLEAGGRLRSVHGGVTLSGSADLTGTRFDERAVSHAEHKRAIARAALRFLPSSGIIAIDAGTTTAELCPLLPTDRPLTVATYSLPVLTATARMTNIEQVSLGGVLHRDSLSYAGPMTAHAIENLSIGTLFLGASSIGARGLFCANDFDALTKRALIDVSDTVVLLADSSKLGRGSFARICGFDKLHHVITDTDIETAGADLLQSGGAELIIAPS
ncbi:DeoR/GlpR family DNA-binding transcription regulator [Microbacterium sp. PRC9]|uniref:DeoR/GlpR family DNA-binding transcription regulator n=1 Tax=Microbacterium sp. PRC9 TaxID=2962591 RepID=UPI002881F1FF|nr:DeoR/GlpR family DNA-binding transcription regulator [Microbacterium sp. PRC9]MDT0143160.1 DeoR/GlpR family DNA-binding transcription regulator [Microbacterium sp. PRC9]